MIYFTAPIYRSYINFFFRFAGIMMGVASTIGGLAFVLAPIVFNKIIYEVSKLDFALPLHTAYKRQLAYFELICANVQWALMHHFLSVCLSLTWPNFT